MRRALLILLSLVVSAAVLVGITSILARRMYVHQVTRSADDLDWLRQEFSLSAADLQRIRQLHEGYLPRCRDYCERIAAKNRELESMLATTNAITDSTARKIAEIATLRAECQTAMLRHFQEVSEAMPPEQGRRYFTEMQRLTLGQHQQFERSMSVESGSHGNH